MHLNSSELYKIPGIEQQAASFSSEQYSVCTPASGQPHRRSDDFPTEPMTRARPPAPELQLELMVQHVRRADPR